MATAEGPIILYDGVCGLCNWLLQFVIRRDRAGVFRFAALQSDVGQALLRQYGLPTAALDTMVLIADKHSYTQSQAVLRVLVGIGGVFRVARLGLLVPPVIRNAVYRLVARNRYRWFGMVDQCMLPTPEVRARFLDRAEQPQAL